MATSPNRLVWVTQVSFLTPADAPTFYRDNEQQPLVQAPTALADGLRARWLVPALTIMTVGLLVAVTIAAFLVLANGAEPMSGTPNAPGVPSPGPPPAPTPTMDALG